MKKPDNSIDFETISIEEAAKTKSPAEQVAHIESLSNQYKVPQEQIAPKPEDIVKINELTESLKTQPSAPEVKKESPVHPEEKIAASNEAYNELLKEYPDIDGVDLGAAHAIISNSNNKYKFRDIEKFALPTVALGMGVVASQAALIPSFIAALATGPTGAVTTAGLMAAGTFGAVPIIAGTGFLAYGGYKLFKKIQENRKLKRDEKKLETVWGNA